MLCDNCKINNATTHIKTIVNGVAREQNLCEECAAKLGYNSLNQGGLTSMLASLFGENMSKTHLSGKQCPNCKTDFSLITKTGKVGCPICYETFKTELLPYIKRVHGSTIHQGKIPNKAPLIVKPKNQTVYELKMQLSRMVAEEKYEEAAVIRDKIKELEGQNNG